ncbi:MAG: preprotein translocase subunit SecY [Oscillospiraceae bacterium]|nr:preprotein translocase subunit SecY [Oscillospiraceae bacterium]
MFDTLKNAWKVADIRKKILFTALILIIFRIGSAIPVPFLDATVMKSWMSSTMEDGNLIGYIDVLTGGAFSNATVFALSISPYITSSIVIQLLTIAIPALERMAKEGEEGRRRINKITRYAAIALGLLQASAYYIMLRNMNAITYTSGFSGVFSAIVIILTFVGGTALIIWLGDQIDSKGIGNGISMLLFAGILSRGPAAASKLWVYIQRANNGETQFYFLVPAVLILFVVIIGFIVLMTNAERRIPVQYAKRVVGRKMYGGQSTHIPIKVNMSGVMPIIFASSLLAIPGTIGAFVTVTPNGFWDKFFKLFSYQSGLYALLYFLLIIAFNYFYVAIQYNPIEMANNLQKNNGTIPGIRPGRPTSEFISKVISKITLVGALFLGAVATVPILLSSLSGMNISLGGTSILIVVGVALDTMRQMESLMMMRHYKGFLE